MSKILIEIGKLVRQVKNPLIIEVYQDLKKAEENARTRAFRRKLKVEVLSHYSGGTPQCKCCSEKEIAFLELDHLNNDGAEHKRSIPHKNAGGLSVQLWAKRNGYPPLFQVLCANCNKAKFTKGTCPHQTDEPPVK